MPTNAAGSYLRDWLQNTGMCRIYMKDKICSESGDKNLLKLLFVWCQSWSMNRFFTLLSYHVIIEQIVSFNFKVLQGKFTLEQNIIVMNSYVISATGSYI